jgi:apolipoprotein N-acyltransferase
MPTIGDVSPGAPVRVRWAALAVVVGGIAAAYAFPQAGIWPLAFVGVASLSWAVDGRRSRTGAWLGLLHGLAFFGPLLHWTGIYVGPVPWLALTVLQALFYGLLGAVLPRLQRLPFAVFWVAAGWVGMEFLRGRIPFGGFPWGRLAFSQAGSPLKWFIAVGGAPFLSFAVALAGAAIAVAVLHARPFSVLRLAPSIAVIAAVPLVGLALGPALHVDAGAPSLKIAVIQGSVPDRGLQMGDRARQVLDNHVKVTRDLAARVKAGQAQQPDLVLWPENASDVDPFVDRSAYDEIDNAVKAINAPVLVGAILDAPSGKRWNAGILWTPQGGPGEQYRKRHPVPFAEYMPLRSLAETFSDAAKLVTNDMLAGGGTGLLNGGPVKIGDVICFEVAYDDLVRSSVDAGAQLLVVQTNNATFGHTSETYQQLAMTRLRAIETGRTTVQVSTTGESAIIDPNGHTISASGALYEPATLTATVTPRSERTLATRLGAGPEYVLSTLALLALAWTLRNWRPAFPRRRRHLDDDPSADQPKELLPT